MPAGARTSFLQFCMATLVIACCIGCGSGGTPVVESPAFSPASGAYPAALGVTLSNRTPGALIYYTTDGTTPTASSTRYTGPIWVTSTVAFNAVGIANGYANSPVVSATYSPALTTLPTAATPVFNPPGGNYTSGQLVAISDATPGASIYYTVDGTTPTTGSTLYTGAIPVSSTETIEAIAVASGYTQSLVGSATYTVSLPVAATPTFNPPAGSYSTAQLVAITDATPGAAIYYTTNGTTPTAGSTLYTGAIPVSSTETIEAIAVASGYTQSAVGSATYTIAQVTGVGQWTWMSGSNAYLASGVYGTRGVASAGNVPGARQTNGNWVDSIGNLWLFGGNGYDSAGRVNELNDLWSYNLATNQWTWVSGSNTEGALGVYGVLGVASPNNVPGSRITGANWVDTDGKFWLFGGIGADSIQASGALNDLWMFNPSTSLWTWEGGDDALGTSGSYGTMGVPSVSNLPGARAAEAMWTDSAGNFWLFGGVGLDANGGFSYLNDLWRFNPKTQQWTWVSGSSTVNAAAVYGTQGVPSAANVPSARDYCTGWVDSAGNFWIFGGSTTNTAFNLLNDLWMFNPNTGQWTWVSGSPTINASGTHGTKGQAAAGNTPGSRFAGTGWAGSDNNLYFFGGTGYSSTGRFNLGAFNDLWTFNTASKLWTWIDGSDLPVVAGVYGTQGISAPGDIPGSRYYVSGWTDRSGNFWLLGGTSEVSNGSGLTNDLWRYVP
jgi:N-acetylneuraminic acid mutarotase